jgi:hypothetical protein
VSVDSCPGTVEQKSNRLEQASVAVCILHFEFFKEGNFRYPFRRGLLGRALRCHRSPPVARQREPGCPFIAVQCSVFSGQLMKIHNISRG